jgi:phage-related tail fiber protein
MNISQALGSIIVTWGIQCKVTSTISDNAANMTAAVNLVSSGGAGARYLPCLAHNHYLLVKRAVESNRILSVIREKARKTVEYFKSSCIAKDKLIDAQKLLRKQSISLSKRLKPDGTARATC